jgi:segregation and condensation protein A
MDSQAGHLAELNIHDFSGPMDLLYHLIEKNRVDIYDIPVSRITEQYLDYLQGMQDLDLEIASEFLVMAATLLQIKSRMLLPQKDSRLAGQEVDPRGELVLRLLEYRRCKAIATRLQERHAVFSACYCRLPETPLRLGLAVSLPPGGLSWDLFRQACEQLSRQNRLRFNDLSDKVVHILRREKVSLKDKMRLIWRTVTSSVRVFFNELFPAGRTSRSERVTGFLALLELLRLNKVKARQDRPFDVILIEGAPGQLIEDDAALDRFLTEAPVEEKDYA